MTTLAYGIMVMLSYLWGQQRYPIPYRVGKSLTYILIGAGVCWLMFDVFDRHVVIGNLLFVVFAGMTFFLERKALFALLKK